MFILVLFHGNTIHSNPIIENKNTIHNILTIHYLYQRQFLLIKVRHLRPMLYAKYRMEHNYAVEQGYESRILVNGMEHIIDLPLLLAMFVNSQTTSTKHDHKI